MDLGRKMLNASVVKRILLAKYFLNLATENSRSHREVSAFASANLLQDAAEIFLLAAIEHLNVRTERRTEFAQYLDKIDDNIAPKVLPFRAKLLQLNKIRISSKHDGIKPDYNELESIIVVAREFFEEASRLIFDTEFSSMNLFSQLDPGEPRDFLEQAEKSHHNKSYVDVLISARKALFLVFESRYDIAKFASGERETILDFCSAPSFAKSKSYIDDHVATPFDFIVYDHIKLDSDLLKDGISPVDFWNIWRLTPQVYQNADGDWLINNEFNKIDADNIEQSATYVLETTIDVILRFQSRRKSARWASHNDFVANLRTKNARIYKKCSNI